MRPPAVLGTFADGEDRRVGNAAQLVIDDDPGAGGQARGAGQPGAGSGPAAQHEQIGAEHPAVAELDPGEPVPAADLPHRGPGAHRHAEGSHGAGQHAGGARVELALHQPPPALEQRDRQPVTG